MMLTVHVEREAGRWCSAFFCAQLGGVFTRKLRANYEQFTNKLRANLLYIENMREYDGCGADEI